MSRLIADIGGTNARFALAAEHGAAERGATEHGAAEHGAAEHVVEVRHERHLPVAGFAGLGDAARAYLAGLPAGTEPVTEAVIAVATPVDAAVIRFTNSPWTFTREGLAAELGVQRLAVINDFAAQAAAIPYLEAEDSVAIGGGVARPDWPIAVIGPGTGLGAAALVPTPSGPIVVASEAGHVSFAPHNALEISILAHLLERHDHVSNERLVSGPGLVTLAQALAAVTGRRFEGTTPEAVSAAAAKATSAVAVEAVGLFSALLGAAAGDLVLSFGAKGGVFICGGLCGKLGRLFDHARFLERLEAKGRLRAFIEDVPCRLVTNPRTGLMGAAAHRLAA